MGFLYREYLKTYKNLNENNSHGFFDVVGDLIDTEEVLSLKQYEQHLEIDRLQHVLGVAYISYLLSKKLGWDCKAAARSGVMHDLVYYDWREKQGGEWHHGHGYKHPKLACLNAKELCPDLSDREADIIKKHMWPFTLALPKYKEGYVIIFADKYCATRELMYSLSKKYKTKFLKDVEEL